MKPQIETLPLICLWQPWAQAVVTPHPTMQSDKGIVPVKNWETRSWRTDFRGRVLVHACHTWRKEVREAIAQPHFTKYFPDMAFLRSRIGHIVGSVEIADCADSDTALFRQFDTLSEYWEQEKMGDFTPGRYAFRLLNPITFDTPIPYKAMQGKILRCPADIIPEKYRADFARPVEVTPNSTLF